MMNPIPNTHDYNTICNTWTHKRWGTKRKGGQQERMNFYAPLCFVPLLLLNYAKHLFLTDITFNKNHSPVAVCHQLMIWTAHFERSALKPLIHTHTHRYIHALTHREQEETWKIAADILFGYGIVFSCTWGCIFVNSFVLSKVFVFKGNCSLQNSSVKPTQLAFEQWSRLTIYYCTFTNRPWMALRGGGGKMGLAFLPSLLSPNREKTDRKPLLSSLTVPLVITNMML